MLDLTALDTLPREQIPAAAQALSKEEIAALVGLLAEKNDAVRYSAFLLLQARSAEESDILPYWDTFLEKLSSENSYQRSIGLMLLAANARWDTAGRTEAALEQYLHALSDEKPITVRQCIQSLLLILPTHPDVCPAVVARLTAFDLAAQRETMRKSLLQDILEVLFAARALRPSDAIDQYIFAAVSGDLLDAKTKKKLLSRMQK